jgi:Domain of unknown function (DUF4157)
MVQRTIAAHSLRHLRFARRVMGAQPPLSRATDDAAIATLAAIYVSPEGRQLPLAPVLRRLPPREPTPEDETATRNTPGAEAASQPGIAPGMAPLRLLPRPPQIEEPAKEPAESDAGIDMAVEPPPRQPEPPRSPPVAAPPPAYPDGLRPRARIVELPGVVELPHALATDVKPESGVERTPPMPQSETPRASADASAVTPHEPPSAREQPIAASTDSAPEPAESTESALPVETRAASRRRSSKRPSSRQAPRASDDLFPPTDADRSARAWLARLQQAARPVQPAPAVLVLPPTESPRDEPEDEPRDEQPPPRRRGGGRQRHARAGSSPSSVAAESRRPDVPMTPTPDEQPEPLAGSSRALLRSLTGVDPTGVPIYRGPAAARATADENADALTDGDAILLGAGHATETPETLGLLAHELTHIAQRRGPRFVPPLAQSARPPAGQRQSPGTTDTPMPPQSSAAGEANEADEETQARQVEAAVRDIASARAQPAAVTPPTAHPPQSPTGQERAQPPREQPTSAGARSPWGNLPAPWEPLPDWLAPFAASRPAAPPPAPASPPATDSAPTAPEADSGIQRAERGRTLPAVEGEAPRPHEERAPEPDLDALAQQIHAILKRRLAAERRRFG